MNNATSEPFGPRAAWSGWFLDRWAEMIDNSADRLDPVVDRRVWGTIADTYDDLLGGASGAAGVWATINRTIGSQCSVLDIGAGTGRLAIPLAAAGHRVTAVDHSPHMLSVLRTKAEAHGVDVATIEHEWGPDSQFAMHDVVLASWSLYRNRNLEAALRGMLLTARHHLVVVTGTGRELAHRGAVLDTCGSWYEADDPAHLLVAGVLWDLGYSASISIIKRTIELSGASVQEIAAQLAPVGTQPDQLVRLGEALNTLVTPGRLGFTYVYETEEALVASRSDVALQ